MAESNSKVDDTLMKCNTVSANVISNIQFVGVREERPPKIGALVTQKM